VTLPAPTALGIVDLREPIAQGQAVAAYRLEGRAEAGWIALAEGTTIGYRRLLTLEPVRLSALRLTVTDAVRAPQPIAVRAFAPAR
jgi:alpha-L-fucosidase